MKSAKHFCLQYFAQHRELSLKAALAKIFMSEILPMLRILGNVELRSTVEIQQNPRGLKEIGESKRREEPQIGVQLFVRLSKPAGTLVVLER